MVSGDTSRHEKQCCRCEAILMSKRRRLPEMRRSALHNVAGATFDVLKSHIHECIKTTDIVRFHELNISKQTYIRQLLHLLSSTFPALSSKYYDCRPSRCTSHEPNSICLNHFLSEQGACHQIKDSL